ncbi:MAG: signal peptidase I, partial [Gammaproteobacteria bacterium]|nr:signal peptidase I [Gammaproteobacteria bacterium]
VGSLAAMSPVNPADIKVGDIISFNPPWDEDVIVSHRVVQVLDNGFVTKGDAVEDSDPFVIPKGNVIGRVSWNIPYVGYALNDVRRFASSIWGFCLVIVLPAMVVLGSALRDANFMYNPGKRRARLLKKRAERLKKRSPRSWQLRAAG